MENPVQEVKPDHGNYDKNYADRNIYYCTKCKCCYDIHGIYPDIPSFKKRRKDHAYDCKENRPRKRSVHK